jgi:hypothetical protein
MNTELGPLGIFGATSLDIGGVTFTADEVYGLASKHLKNITDPNSESLGILALSRLRDLQEEVIAVNDEAGALQIEGSLSTLAVTAIGAYRSAKKPTDPLVSRTASRPLAKAVADREEATRRTELDLEVETLSGDITRLQSPLVVTGKELRQWKYSDHPSDTRNGAWLKQKLCELPVPNSDETLNRKNKAAFRGEEAEFLSGFVVRDMSAEMLSEVLVGVAEKLEKLRGLNTRWRTPTMLSAFNQLQELYEGDGRQLLERNSDLLPLINWYKKFLDNDLVEGMHDFPGAQTEEQPSTLEDEESTDSTTDINNELPENNPFDNSPTLPIVAFTSKEKWSELDGVRELNEDETSEDAILNDMTAHVKNAGGRHVIEPARARQFISLLGSIKEAYGAEFVRTYQTLKPEWHSMPWYVIEIAVPGKSPLVVLETVISGNASYTVKSPEWREVISFQRTEAQLFGARPLNHVYDLGLLTTQHEHDLFNRVIIGMGMQI